MRPWGYPSGLDHCHYLCFPFMLLSRRKEVIVLDRADPLWFHVISFQVSLVTLVKVECLCGNKRRGAWGPFLLANSFNQEPSQWNLPLPSPYDHCIKISSPFRTKCLYQLLESGFQTSWWPRMYNRKCFNGSSLMGERVLFA